MGSQGIGQKRKPADGFGGDRGGIPEGVAEHASSSFHSIVRNELQIVKRKSGLRILCEIHRQARIGDKR